MEPKSSLLFGSVAVASRIAKSFHADRAAFETSWQLAPPQVHERRAMMRDRTRERAQFAPGYADELKQCGNRIGGGEALPNAHHNGGSRVVAGIRDIAIPTI